MQYVRITMNGLLQVNTGRNLRGGELFENKIFMNRTITISNNVFNNLTSKTSNT